ncbi:cobalamin biosynthesis protein CobD/CbiB [Thalassotalea sp. PLHSN55]|uniref:cobalamin biosynthesis protein CobD/CbiB n=1 Tax=Thalassotalea sp. PLHSN55 TaxID=3435888 RepID=UPI003F83AEEF
MASFAELPSWLQSVLMAFTVILIKAILTHLVAHQPWRFFQFYCQSLANKVNKAENSHSQQTVAGLVAFAITFAPLVAILWLFETFVAVLWLWQGFLLYIAIDGVDLFSQNKKIANALSAQQKYHAKQLLQPFLLRESEKLSSLGLTKASIEMQLLRIGQQLITTVFFFLLLGPLAAISYRIILEMSYSWNTKEARFFAFGDRPKTISYLLQWLPMRVYGFCLLLSTLGQGFVLNWRLVSPHFFKLNNDFVLHIQALALGCRLGGVAMYQGEKLRRKSFNDQGKQPEITDIIHASSRIKYILVLLSICFFLAIFAALTVAP